MIKKCFLCGGKAARKFVTAENWWGDDLTLIENVPAWVCDNCGEQYFEPEVCEELDHLRKAPPADKKIIQIPVYNFPKTRQLY
jgi:YgiT-type zinc finger domain-containing protein